MNWENLLAEGDAVVKIIRDGLRKRGINAGDPVITDFNTDEDIPVYNDLNQKIFWISVKTVYGDIQDPISQMPSYYRGWMCGEVESKQWINPPAVIIWYCVITKAAWGAITPKRLSTEWIIFPDRHGIAKDKRKTRLTGKDCYLYPSYCVPNSKILSKNEIIAYIQKLSKS